MPRDDVHSRRLRLSGPETRRPTAGLAGRQPRDVDQPASYPAPGEYLKRDDRARRFLETASDCFSSHGYAATSLDHILERCGGSKASIYEIFGSKQGLLEALIRDRSKRMAHAISGSDKTSAISSQATAIAEQLLDLALNPSWIQTLRLLVAEGCQQPDLRSLFLELAVGPLEEELHNFFRGWTWIEGKSPASVGEVTDLFLNLVMGTSTLKLLALGGQTPTGANQQKHIDFAVSAFLRIAAPPPASGAVQA